MNRIYVRALAATISAFSLMSCRPAWAAQDYWAGHLQVADFDFAQNWTEGSRPSASPWESASLTTFAFAVYQNPAGLVLRQLTAVSRNRNFEPGLDVQLLDYAHGFMISFNKGAKTAYKSPMPIPGYEVTDLPPRRILGHECRGVETRWKNLNNHLMVVDKWTPTDCDFRDSLVKILNASSPAGRLEKITVEVMTELNEVKHLDDSLFRLPDGISVKSFQ